MKFPDMGLYKTTNHLQKLQLIPSFAFLAAHLVQNFRHRKMPDCTCFSFEFHNFNG